MINRRILVYVSSVHDPVLYLNIQSFLVLPQPSIKFRNEVTMKKKL